MFDSHAVSSPNPEYSRLGVRFYLTPLYDEKASKGWMEEVPDLNTGEVKKFWHKGAGREIWRDAEFIEIRIPGNVSEVRNREVRESDKEKWPREYAAFKAGQEAPPVGIPLEKLPFLTLSQVQEFRAVGVRTAEDLVAMSDSDAQKFMGINKIKQQSKDHLLAMEGNVPLGRLATELDSRDKEIAALKAQVLELAKHERKAK